MSFCRSAQCRSFHVLSSNQRQLMRVPKSGTLLVACATAAIVALGGTPLRAQQAAVIKGRVTAQTGEPLGGANVIVANTNLGAVTAQNGTYTITIGQEAARGQQVVLTARYIGHKPVARTVTLSQGEQEQNFELAADPLRLEEVVVTGVGEATSLKKLPFAVARVTEEQLQAVPGQSAPRRRSDGSPPGCAEFGTSRTPAIFPATAASALW